MTLIAAPKPKQKINRKFKLRWIWFGLMGLVLLHFIFSGFYPERIYWMISDEWIGRYIIGWGTFFLLGLHAVLKYGFHR